MGKNGKKLRSVKKKMPGGILKLEEAVQFLKENPVARFDETVDIAMKLGVDPKKSDQAIRGTVSLPHGTGKNVKVLVFAAGETADAAREAGAEFVGNEDMIEKVKDGWTDFDVAIATPDAMKEVRKLGRVLGPRGLMPNPKTGTVTDDVATAVQQAKAGRVEFRMDRAGNINVPCGKLSFDADKLVENATAIIKAVQAEKPAGVKGALVRKCFLSSTMGAGLGVEVQE